MTTKAYLEATQFVSATVKAVRAGRVTVTASKAGYRAATARAVVRHRKGKQKR